MSGHAILAPSSSERWLNCTRSARLEEKEPHSTSPAAEWGTLAHDLGQYLIKQHLHTLGLVLMSQSEISDNGKNIMSVQKNQLYDDEMLDLCYGFRDFVIEAFQQALEEDPNATIFLEVHIPLGAVIPESFGRADVIIMSEKRMHNIDLKTGRVEVKARENNQLKIYSIGAVLMWDFLFSPRTIYATIYQPRIGNIDTWIFSREYLLSWAYSFLKPTADVAFKGEGEFKAGPHCKFCKVTKCKALAEYNLELAEKEFREAVLLSDDEIIDILAKADVFEDWLDKIKTFALEQAEKHNKKWPGFKLVEGRSNRTYKSEESVELRLLASKIPNENIYKPKELWGITELEKRLGTEKFNEYVGDLITKPTGSLKLVPESSSKPEYNSLEKAQSEFMVWEELGSRPIFTEDPNDLI